MEAVRDYHVVDVRITLFLSLAYIRDSTQRNLLTALQQNMQHADDYARRKAEDVAETETAVARLKQQLQVSIQTTRFGFAVQVYVHVLSVAYVCIVCVCACLCVGKRQAYADERHCRLYGR